MTSSDDEQLRTVFDAAVDVVQRLPKQGPISTSNADKLRFYALYKQATVGACSVARPAFWNAIERFKWDAWNQLHDMSQQEAMREYVRQMRLMIDKVRNEYDVNQWMDDPNDTVHMRKQLTLIGVDLTSPAKIVNGHDHDDTNTTQTNALIDAANDNRSEPISIGNQQQLMMSSSPTSDEDAFTDAKETIIRSGLTKSRGKGKPSRASQHRSSDSDERQQQHRRGNSASPKVRGGTDTDWILFESGMFGRSNSRRSRELRRNNNGGGAPQSSSNRPAQGKSSITDADGGGGSGSGGRRAQTSSSSSAGSGDYSPLVSFDPHMASVLFRLHRQLQHIQRQLDGVETILDDQRQTIHNALRQRYIDDHYFRLYFFKDLPWRTILFILAWPFVVNVLCRLAYRRMMRMRSAVQFSRKFL